MHDTILQRVNDKPWKKWNRESASSPSSFKKACGGRTWGGPTMNFQVSFSNTQYEKWLNAKLSLKQILDTNFNWSFN